MKKQKTQIRSALTYKPLARDIEHPKGDSLTIPGEAYSLQDLILRAQGGIPVESTQSVHYSNTDDFDDIDPASAPDFDLVDAESLLRQSEDVISAANELLNEAQKKPQPKTKVEAKTEGAEPDEHSETKKATSGTAED